MVGQLAREIGMVFRRWFHKRNIIIMSEKGVKHVPVSGGVQFCAVVAAAGFVCWACYSTGSYLAAHDALRQQGKTLRSVTSAHVNTSFSPLVTSSLPAPTAAQVSLSPSLALTPQQSQKMATRLAYLESRVTQLQNANAEIIQRVQEKTAGKIDDLETIIRQTGLDMDRVRREAKQSQRPRADKSQGGPYIPADMVELRKSADELFSELDELSRLRDIVSALPLGVPIKGAQQQSHFGHRYDPFTNRLAFHSGLDLSGPPGSRVHSTAAGVVASAEHNGAYGNMVDIDHGNGIVTRYAHLSRILVETGQSVRQGEAIGVQGSTGRSTGAHLHYEVRYNDKPMNPKNFLQAGQYVSQK